MAGHLRRKKDGFSWPIFLLLQWERHHDAFNSMFFSTCASMHAPCRELSSQFYEFAWARAKEKFYFAASFCVLSVVIDWLANRNCRWDEMLSVT